MATAVYKKAVYENKPVLIEEGGVVLTLNHEEAKQLRHLLGYTSPYERGDQLGAVWKALDRAGVPFVDRTDYPLPPNH